MKKPKSAGNWGRTGLIESEGLHPLLFASLPVIQRSITVTSEHTSRLTTIPRSRQQSQLIVCYSFDGVFYRPAGTTRSLNFAIIPPVLDAVITRGAVTSPVAAAFNQYSTIRFPIGSPLAPGSGTAVAPPPAADTLLAPPAYFDVASTVFHGYGLQSVSVKELYVAAFVSSSVKGVCNNATVSAGTVLFRFSISPTTGMAVRSTFASATSLTVPETASTYVPAILCLSVDGIGFYSADTPAAGSLFDTNLVALPRTPSALFAMVTSAERATSEEDTELALQYLPDCLANVFSVPPPLSSSKSLCSMDTPNSVYSSIVTDVVSTWNNGATLHAAIATTIGVPLSAVSSVLRVATNPPILEIRIKALASPSSTGKSKVLPISDVTARLMSSAIDGTFKPVGIAFNYTVVRATAYYADGSRVSTPRLAARDVVKNAMPHVPATESAPEPDAYQVVTLLLIPISLAAIAYKCYFVYWSLDHFT